MKSISSIVGVILIVLGGIGLFYKYIPYESNVNVAEIGPVKLKTVEENQYVISPAISTASIAIGVILLAAGVLRKK